MLLRKFEIIVSAPENRSSRGGQRGQRPKLDILPSSFMLCSGAELFKGGQINFAHTSGAFLPLVKIFLPHLKTKYAPDEKNPGHDIISKLFYNFTKILFSLFLNP